MTLQEAQVIMKESSEFGSVVHDEDCDTVVEDLDEVVANVVGCNKNVPVDEGDCIIID